MVVVVVVCVCGGGGGELVVLVTSVVQVAAGDVQYDVVSAFSTLAFRISATGAAAHSTSAGQAGPPTRGAKRVHMRCLPVNASWCKNLCEHV
jgi:hypothetical protein